MATPSITPDQLKRLQQSGVLPPNPFASVGTESSSPLSTAIASPRPLPMGIPGPILGQPSLLGDNQGPSLLKADPTLGDSGSLRRLPMPDFSSMSPFTRTPSDGHAPGLGMSLLAPPSSGSNLPSLDGESGGRRLLPKIDLDYDPKRIPWPYEFPSNNPLLGRPLLPTPNASSPTLQGIPTTLDSTNGQMPSLAQPGQVRLNQDQAKLNYMRNSGTGISQIGQNVDAQGNKTDAHGGFLKTLGKIGATVGDDALAVFAPNVERFIPGGYGHHQELLGQQQAAVGSDEDQLQAGAKLQESQAHAQQQQYMAQQEWAKSQALLNPKPSNGELLYDKNGSPLGFRDGQGNYMGADDPNLPHGVSDILSAAQRKQPTNAFELWQQQNPKGAAEDYIKLEADGKNKPLDQQLADAEAAGDDEKAKTIRNVIRETKVQPRIDIHNGTAQPTGLPSGSSTNSLVQAIIEGRAPAPTSRSRQGMALMAAVTAADPTYDATRYPTYQAMQQEMSKGKTGAAINSLNTIQEHISRALKNMPDNTGNSAINWLKNSGEEAFGGNPTGKYEVDATGIAGEWGKLVAGGVASEAEQKHVQQLLSPNASPQKMRDNLAEVKAMTDGKLAGIQRQIDSARPPWMHSNPASSLPSGGDVQASRPANVPSGYLSITDSQGGQHWIPPQSLRAAQQRDPGLKVSQ